MENLKLHGITQEESEQRRFLVNYGTHMLQAAGLPITAEMRELDTLFIALNPSFEEFG